MVIVVSYFICGLFIDLLKQSWYNEFINIKFEILCLEYKIDFLRDFKYGEKFVTEEFRGCQVSIKERKNMIVVYCINNKG